MFTYRWLALSVAGLISMASFVFQSQPSADERIAALETSQAKLELRVGALETVAKTLLRSSAKPASVLPTPTLTPDPDGAIYDLVSLNTKITESNKYFKKWSWILTIENKTDKTLVVDVVIKFLDEEGFIVDEDKEYNLLLSPHETKEFTGTRLIDEPAASTVDHARAESEMTSWR